MSPLRQFTVRGCPISKTGSRVKASRAWAGMGFDGPGFRIERRPLQVPKPGPSQWRFRQALPFIEGTVDLLDLLYGTQSLVSKSAQHGLRMCTFKDVRLCILEETTFADTAPAQVVQELLLAIDPSLGYLPFSVLPNPPVRVLCRRAPPLRKTAHTGIVHRNAGVSAKHICNGTVWHV